MSSIIDIGQIEGAFAQGYGLFMLEQMIHSPDGVLLTRGPGAYKLPGKNRKLRSKLSHILNFWQLLSFEIFSKYFHLDFLVNHLTSVIVFILLGHTKLDTDKLALITRGQSILFFCKSAELSLVKNWTQF